MVELRGRGGGGFTPSTLILAEWKAALGSGGAPHYITTWFKYLVCTYVSGFRQIEARWLQYKVNTYLINSIPKTEARQNSEHRLKIL